MQGVTEPISRVLKQAGFRVAMKPHRTLRQELVKPKDKVSDKPGVVYQINCQDCEASYVGQTGRNLSQRVKEHKSATEKGRTLNSGIAQHAWDEHHTIDWDNIKILGQESHERKRQIRESLFIQKIQPRMNRDTGLDHPSVYDSVAKQPIGSTDVSREPPAPRDDLQN